MIRSRTYRVTFLLGTGGAVLTSWILPPGSAVAQPVGLLEAEVNAAWRPAPGAAATAARERKRAYGLSTAADVVRAGGTAGVATGGGLVLGVVTGPLAGIPNVGPTLADQATKTWGTLQASVADGAVAFADAMSQAAEPLAPGLNEISAPAVRAADSLALSSAAAEQHLTRFGLRTNLVSYPFGTAAQLAHALS
jgi:hypothetical protein